MCLCQSPIWYKPDRASFVFVSSPETQTLLLKWSWKCYVPRTDLRTDPSVIQKPSVLVAWVVRGQPNRNLAVWGEEVSGGHLALPLFLGWDTPKACGTLFIPYSDSLLSWVPPSAWGKWWSTGKAATMPVNFPGSKGSACQALSAPFPRWRSWGTELFNVVILVGRIWVSTWVWMVPRTNLCFSFFLFNCAIFQVHNETSFSPYVFRI